MDVIDIKKTALTFKNVKVPALEAIYHSHAFEVMTFNLAKLSDIITEKEKESGQTDSYSRDILHILLQFQTSMETHKNLQKKLFDQIKEAFDNTLDLLGDTYDDRALTDEDLWAEDPKETPDPFLAYYEFTTGIEALNKYINIYDNWEVPPHEVISLVANASENLVLIHESSTANETNTIRKIQKSMKELDRGKYLYF